MNYSVNSEEERAFLERYNINDYDRPSLAADIVTFAMMQDGRQDNIRKLVNRELKVLLIKRAAFPYKNSWAIPGGFVRKGETVEEAAKRELFEETGVKDSYLRLAGVYSDTERDPRGWIISNSFISIVDAMECSLRADTDAWEAAWFNVLMNSEVVESEKETVTYRHTLRLTNEEIVLEATVLQKRKAKGHKSSSVYVIEANNGLAFDHAKIIVSSMVELREIMRNDLRLAFDFLPDTFTLAQMQNTVEKVLDTELLTANFRRKVAAYVEETGEVVEGEGHRPAQLFSVKI